MCNAFKELEAEWMERGKTKGIKYGIEQGIEQGVEQEKQSHYLNA